MNDIENFGNILELLSFYQDKGITDEFRPTRARPGTVGMDGQDSSLLTWWLTLAPLEPDLFSSVPQQSPGGAGMVYLARSTRFKGSGSMFTGIIAFSFCVPL